VGDIHHSFFTAQVLNGFPAKKKWYIHGVVKTDLHGVVVDINLFQAIAAATYVRVFCNTL